MSQALGDANHVDAAGEIVAICDTGFDVGTTSPVHPDFAGRVKAITSYPITPDLSPYIKNPLGDDGPADLDSGHGTHVAGSVLGDGSASTALAGQAPVRGIAHKARLVFQAIEQALDWKNPADLQHYGRYILAGIPADISTIFQYAYSKGARIHSNSWGGGEPGAYDSQCRQLDEFVWNHPTMCILFSAGNDGTDSDGDGKINLGSVTAPGTAKNCITVGACENLRRAFDTQKYGAWWPHDYPAAPLQERGDGRRPGSGRRVLESWSDRRRAGEAGRDRSWHVDPVDQVDDAEQHRDRMGSFRRVVEVLLHGWHEHGDAAHRRCGGCDPAVPASRPRDRQPDRRRSIQAVLIVAASRLPNTAPAAGRRRRPPGLRARRSRADRQAACGHEAVAAAEHERRDRSESAPNDHGHDCRVAAADRARLRRLSRGAHW